MTGWEPLAIASLIFGGCCTNVFALERIVNVQPKSGLIITFLQFSFTAGSAFFTQIDTSAPYALRRPKVPLPRWAFIAFMFSGINILNNWAFAYNISVPVHIILRSFGSVTTMLAGMIRGRKFSSLQIVSVMLLTAGVLVSAWADSRSKGKSMSVESSVSSSEFAQGLAVLLVAQLMSAYMGAYTEDTYAEFKASWTENLFYSHFLSLPFFLPMSSLLQSQYQELAATPRVNARQYRMCRLHSHQTATSISDRTVAVLCKNLEALPKGAFFLFTNAVTQLVCISGVNLLAAKSSAVTVTIVLNIRKLVSFILSTLIFGHKLDALMILGSALVFGSGALYGWETSWRLPRLRKEQTTNKKTQIAAKAD